jgi:hypothetical protein
MATADATNLIASPDDRYDVSPTMLPTDPATWTRMNT